MNIHQLRCAVTVARLGSQTRAAEELYMSQPNLSKALKDLEQTCGFRIFTRTGTGMAPTRRGEEFLEHARAVLEELDLMRGTSARPEVDSYYVADNKIYIKTIHATYPKLQDWVDKYWRGGVVVVSQAK